MKCPSWCKRRKWKWEFLRWSITISFPSLAKVGCLSKIQSLQTFLQSIEISQYELSWEVRYFRRSELQRNIRKVLFRGETCAQNWSETNQSNLATKKPSHLSELQKILWTFYWRGDLCLELGGEEVNQLLVLDAGLHKLLPANNSIRPQLFFLVSVFCFDLVTFPSELMSILVKIPWALSSGLCCSSTDAFTWVNTAKSNSITTWSGPIIE